MSPAKANWSGVRRIALALPQSIEVDSAGLAQWRVGDKLFAWERPLRPSDLRALGKKAPSGPILGLRVEHLLAKEALLSAKPAFCFTTPHFDGYPAVLIQLAKIPRARLEELIVDAWLARAPKRLVRGYLEASRRKS